MQDGTSTFPNVEYRTFRTAFQSISMQYLWLTENYWIYWNLTFLQHKKGSFKGMVIPPYITVVLKVTKAVLETFLLNSPVSKILLLREHINWISIKHGCITQETIIHLFQQKDSFITFSLILSPLKVSGYIHTRKAHNYFHCTRNDFFQGLFHFLNSDT